MNKLHAPSMGGADLKCYIFFNLTEKVMDTIIVQLNKIIFVYLNTLQPKNCHKLIKARIEWSNIYNLCGTRRGRPQLYFSRPTYFQESQRLENSQRGGPVDKTLGLSAGRSGVRIPGRRKGSLRTTTVDARVNCPLYLS